MTEDTIDLERCLWDDEYRTRAKRLLNSRERARRRSVRSVPLWPVAHDSSERKAA